jgi:competence protein ComGC
MKLAATEAAESQVKRGLAAFSLKELLIVLAALVLLMGLFLPALAKAKAKRSKMSCAGVLRNVGLAFRVFATDNNDLFPVQLLTNAGGTLELIESGEVFRHFQVMSNELSTPKLLVCPVDGAQGRMEAARFDVGFTDENISYFVGLDANETLPDSILSGDRNLEGGKYVGKRIFQFTSNNIARWGTNLHVNRGNLVRGDGSVFEPRSADLPQVFDRSGILTNRLAIPKCRRV